MAYITDGGALVNLDQNLGKGTKNEGPDLAYIKQLLAGNRGS